MDDKGKKDGFFKRILPKLGLFFDIEKLKKIVDLSYIIIERLSLAFPMVADDYLAFYEELVEGEIRLANITQADKVLNIGSGPIPATSILLDRKTGASITCIDIDKKTVEQAKKFLKMLDKHRIRVEQADGTKYDAHSFDVIFVSWGVNNLFQILKNVSETMKDDARIVVRLPKSEKFQKKLEQEFKGKICIRDFLFHPSYSNSKSILLVKNTR